MDEHSGNRRGGYWQVAVACLAVIVLCFAYFGAYLALVEPVKVGVAVTGGTETFVIDLYRWPGSDDFWESSVLDLMFTPANFIDRRLRPGKWSVKP